MTKTIRLSIATTFFFIISLGSSCQEKRTNEMDKEVIQGIFAAMVNVGEQSIEMNTRIIKNINGINFKFQFFMYDSQSRKTTQKILPINEKVTEISNDVDYVFLNLINYLIEKETGNETWFLRNEVSQFSEYKSLYTLDNIESSKWTTLTLGSESDESMKRADNLRKTLITYRDGLIMVIADSVKNDKNQLKLITQTNLINYDSFQTHLDSIRHPNKNDLLSIYSGLTIPETVKFANSEYNWHTLAFHNQPMISAITTLNSYRNKIRIAQEMACKMLLSRIDKPLKPLHEYQKVGK